MNSSESILGDEPETIAKSAISPKKDESYSFTAKVDYVYTVIVEYKKGTVYYAFAPYVELLKDVDSLDRYLHGIITDGSYATRCQKVFQELAIKL